MPEPLPDCRDWVDIDLYCLKCGYNLRGLSGDPRRCPECGHLNPTGEREVPPEVIQEYLRRMESWPTICAGAVLGTAIPLVGIVLAATTGLSRDVQDLLPCGSVLLVLSPVAWLLAMRQFKRDCLAKSGWERALWRYHVYVLGFAAAMMLMIASGRLLERPAERLSYGPLIFLLSWAFLAIVLARLGGRWIRERLRREIRPLQLERATTLAREECRRALEYRVSASRATRRADDAG